MNLAIASNALKEMAQILNVTTKSVDEIVNEYNNIMSPLVLRAFQGKIDARELAAQHRVALRELAAQVYFEGMKAGGVEQTEADDTDRQTIKDWIDEQTTHVRDFASAAQDAGSDKLSREAVRSRLDLWLIALRSLGDLGFASAQKNAMGTWELGATEEHCNTCAQLNGKRHRLSWWVKYDFIPRQPGSTTLDCGGWNCDCRIVADDGRVLLPA